MMDCFPYKLFLTHDRCLRFGKVTGFRIEQFICVFESELLSVLFSLDSRHSINASKESVMLVVLYYD